MSLQLLEYLRSLFNVILKERMLCGTNFNQEGADVLRMVVAIVEQGGQINLEEASLHVA